MISKSNTLKSIVDSVQNGLDPGIYSVKDQVKWYKVDTKEQFFALIDSLNIRGIREQPLLSNLNNEKAQIVEEYLEEERQQERLANKRQVKPVQKKNDLNQGIDKSLFKCMEDFIEGSLRDSILELEERIWVAGFGGISPAEREEWRRKIEDGMSKLIQVSTKKEAGGDNDQTNSTAMEVDVVKVNGHINEVNGDNVKEGDNHQQETTDSMEVDSDNAKQQNINVTESNEAVKPMKALPLHLKDDVKEEGERSRCSTPIEENPENDRIDLVRELARELLKVSSY